MQAALKFFDFPFNGTGEQGVHKIGIKLPTRSAQECPGDETGFMEILAALTQIPPRELSSSLAQLDWVPVADDTGELAPLIDLTGRGNSNLSIVEMLLSAGGGDASPASGSDTESEPKPIPKTGVAVSEAALALQDAAAALAKSSERQATPSQGTPQTQKPGSGTTLVAPRFQAIDAGGAAMDTASRSSHSAARFVLADPAADTAVARFGQDPTNTAAAASSPENQALLSTEVDFLSDGAKRALNARMAREFNDGKGRADMQTADGRTQMPGQGTAETAFRQEAFAFKATQPPAARGTETTAERSFAQGAGASVNTPAGDDQRFGQTVRSVTPSVRQDGDIPLKPIDGSKIQSSIPTTREDSPSFDARLSDAVPKTVGSESAAKEVMPFVEKDTHTDVIRQIVQRMTLRTEKHQSQMIIRLKPDFLGHVKLHVSTVNQQVTVRMEAESSIVKEIVEQNMPHLKAELHQHGLQIEKFDVFVGNQNDGWQNGQHSTGFRQASKRNGQSPAGNHAEDEPHDRSEETGVRSSAYRGYRNSEVDYFA